MADNFLERHREDYEQRKADLAETQEASPKNQESLPFSVLMIEAL